VLLGKDGPLRKSAWDVAHRPWGMLPSCGS